MGVLAAMPPPTLWKTYLIAAGTFVLGAICTALVGVPAGLHVAKQANTALVIQQQTLTDLQAFESTGAKVDNSVRKVSDVLVKGRNAEPARDELRDSVAAHSSAAFILRDEMGSEYEPYMFRMRQMRSFADEADNPREGVLMWQAAVDLIAMRKRAADRIKAEATR